MTTSKENIQVFNKKKRYLSKDILMPSFLLSTVFISSNAIAFDEVFDKINPTGYWYTNTEIDYYRIDGCFSPLSGNAIRYEAIYDSFDEAKKEQFNKFYRGGECKEYSFELPFNPPEDWPLSNSQWDALQKQRPNAPKTMDINYHCVKSNSEEYSFYVRLQPQYRCDDRRCSEYRTACAGDIYAGDLLQSPFELLGHTGFIYSSAELDPTISHLVMEVLNTPPIIHTNTTLREIKNIRPVWGVRYGYGSLYESGEMTYFEAMAMFSAGLVQSQFCPIYTKEPIYKVGGYQSIIVSNPLNHQKKELLTNNCAVFRCDTFIQYIYKAGLNVQLPPQYLLDMPKDLFNAFPNQRGDRTPVSNIRLIENNTISTQNSKRSQELFALYQDKNKDRYSRSTALDALVEANSIAFQALLIAAYNEEDNELKGQLLYLLFEKAKKENVSKKDWRSLKLISLNTLHSSCVVVQT